MKKIIFISIVFLISFNLIFAIYPVMGKSDNSAIPAIPAVPATPAQPQKGGPAIRAIHATPAQPAVPYHKQDLIHTIVLENQDSSGMILGDDDINGAFSYYVEDNKFNFSFTGKAPTANNWYALVVGEDPLNHPETAVILNYPRSDGNTGEIIINDGVFELNRDLRNAKVWLVLGSDLLLLPRYDGFTGWNGWRSEYYLFGTNLINY